MAKKESYLDGLEEKVLQAQMIDSKGRPSMGSYLFLSDKCYDAICTCKAMAANAKDKRFKASALRSLKQVEARYDLIDRVWDELNN